MSNTTIPSTREEAIERLVDLRRAAKAALTSADWDFLRKGG